MEVSLILTGVSDQYGIEVVDYTSLNSRTFLLETNEGPFLLKEKKRIVQLTNECHLLEYLKSKGISVGLPLVTIHERFYMEVQNRYYMVQEYIPGIIYQDLQDLDEPEKRMKQIGLALGKLHLALKDAAVVVKKHNAYKTMLDLIHQSKWTDEQLHALKPIISYLNQYQHLAEQLPKQLIHRDCHLSNLIFTDDQIGFIDFELAQESYRLFDVAYVLTSLLVGNFEQSKETWLMMIKPYLSAYQAINPLTKIELKLMKWMMLHIQLIFAGYFKTKKMEIEANLNLDVADWIMKQSI
jgi:Ser/Thr protein kinase RdoA (MazF antagonist)